MKKKKIKNIIIILLLAATPFLIRSSINFVKPILTTHTSEEIKEMMEEHLYEKYGEEFVVDRLGTRTARDTEFYQARIYSKSIVGTNKEYDDYYHASASINKKSFGRLGGVGDSYGLTKINLRAEEYLLPKTKKIFGDRVKLKTDVKYKIENSYGFYEWNRKPYFSKALENVKENPDGKRIELDLDVYVFERIKDHEEKEERREDIFEFVQYLQEEGLFEYLELGVIFIDERVLADSYDDFEREVRVSSKVREEIDGDTVRIPPMDLREEISRELQKEVDEMNEEELLANMQKIRKNELENFIEYDMQYVSLIYSYAMLKERYSSSITKDDRKKKDDKYNKVDNILLEQPYKYMYLN